MWAGWGHSPPLPEDQSEPSFCWPSALGSLAYSLYSLTSETILTPSLAPYPLALAAVTGSVQTRPPHDCLQDWDPDLIGLSLQV